MVNAFRLMVFVIGLAVIIGSMMVTSAGKPIIVIISPSNGETVYTDKITVSGGATGTEGAIVKSVTVKDIHVDGTTSWSVDISLQPGLNEITVEAKDNMEQSSSKTITVTYIAPTPPPTPIPIPNGGHIPTPTPTPGSTPTGRISITTIPSGAEIYWDGVPKGNTSITLEDVVGHHRVKVIKEGFHSKNKSINLHKGITKELKIELEPITGSIVVYSIPSGACVYLDNVDRKANTTCKLSEVAMGNHTIKLTKSDYFDVERIVSVSNSSPSPTELHVNLTGYGYINISSNSPGAKVYLDGNYTGETTTKNISKVVVGNHTIKLTLSDYFDEIKNVSVSVGRTFPVHIHLTECGYISIDSEPSRAKVYLDGVYMGETPMNNSKVALGNHSINLTKSWYDPVIRNVTVSVGEPLHLDENLTGYGSLSIFSYPSANVYLDGVYMGITPLNISKVVEGSHSINLTKFGYVAVKEKIDVSVGKTEHLDKTLSASTEWLTLIMVLSAIALIALEEALRGFIRKRIIPFIRSIREKYLLFSLDPTYRPYLKEGNVDEKLKKVFEDNGVFFPTEPKLSKIAKKQWKIEDGEMQCIIEDTEKRLNIYKKRSN